MTENRPNAIALAETLRGLGECWDVLDAELGRHDGKASRGGAKSKPPLALEVLDAKRAIDGLAFTYAHMLMEDTDWEPPRGADTPALLDALAYRIGHFTHGDSAQVAYEFADDVERVWREASSVAFPSGRARIPVGPCLEAECDGRMMVAIDRDRPLDERALALWQPTAVCDQESAHVMLARAYADTLKMQVAPV